MLSAQKIFLGPMTPDDAAILFRWANNPDLAHLNRPYRPIDWMNHHTWFQSLGGDQSMVMFAIRRIEDSGFVGYIEIRNIHSVYRSAEIGVQIGEPENRGKGYGGEAIELARQFCWRDLNLERLSLVVFADNHPAIRAYEKAGFAHEGTMRGAVYVDGRRTDLEIMASLRSTEPPAPHP